MFTWKIEVPSRIVLDWMRRRIVTIKSCIVSEMLKAKRWQTNPFDDHIPKLFHPYYVIQSNLHNNSDVVQVLTTYLSMKSEGGPPCLVRGPSGAVQIGRGIFVLPLKEKKWNGMKLRTKKKKTEMLELTFNSIKYSQASFFWSSIVFFIKIWHQNHTLYTSGINCSAFRGGGEAWRSTDCCQSLNTECDLDFNVNRMCKKMRHCCSYILTEIFS